LRSDQTIADIAQQTRQKSSGDEVYYARQRINNLANSIITFMVLVLLIVPIYLLYHLINDIGDGRSYAICMGILVVSTLAFSAVLCLFTRAKRHEILAAAAAYCAVLVVFLGNVNPSRKG
jgi:drug/metabolite transporter superfamily protein YnfA